MAKLKRAVIKYIRDFIKKDYKLRDKCYICNSEENLELHHLYSVSQLFEQWCTKNKVRDIDTVEQIVELRVPFAEDCKDKLSIDNLYTLCSDHHKRLHNIYGQNYSNHLVPKILNWLDIQRNKTLGS